MTRLLGLSAVLVLMTVMQRTASVSLTKLQPSDVDKLTLSDIPRIIHQTWKSDERPDWDVSISTCIPMHEGYEIMMHTDAGMDAFIRTHYPQYYQMYTEKFIAIQVGREKSMCCAMCILCKHLRKPTLYAIS